MILEASKCTVNQRSTINTSQYASKFFKFYSFTVLHLDPSASEWTVRPGSSGTSRVACCASKYKASRASCGDHHPVVSPWAIDSSGWSMVVWNKWIQMGHVFSESNSSEYTKHILICHHLFVYESIFISLNPWWIDGTGLCAGKLQWHLCPQEATQSFLLRHGVLPRGTQQGAAAKWSMVTGLWDLMGFKWELYNGIQWFSSTYLWRVERRHKSTPMPKL